MKMYILIKEDVPNGFAILSASHASVGCYRKFQDRKEMQDWANGIFYKVICKVSDAEFQKAKEIPDHVLITESKLDNKELAIAFCPREEYPKMFNFFKLWK